MGTGMRLSHENGPADESCGNGYECTCRGQIGLVKPMRASNLRLEVILEVFLPLCWPKMSQAQLMSETAENGRKSERPQNPILASAAQQPRP